MFKNFVKKSFVILATALLLGSSNGSELRAGFYFFEPAEPSQNALELCGERTNFQKDLKDMLAYKAQLKSQSLKFLTMNLRFACFPNHRFSIGAPTSGFILVLFVALLLVPVFFKDKIKSI